MPDDIDPIRRQIRQLRHIYQADRIVAHVHPDDYDQHADDLLRLAEEEGIEIVQTEHAEPGGVTFMPADDGDDDG